MPPIRVLQIMPAMDAMRHGDVRHERIPHHRPRKVQFDFLYHYDKPCFLTMRYVPWAAVFTS